jgi:hypothetical protein
MLVKLFVLVLSAGLGFVKLLRLVRLIKLCKVGQVIHILAY